MEGTASAIQTAIVNMCTTIVSQGQDMIAAVVPAAAPLVATVIVAGLGYRFVRRFTA